MTAWATVAIIAIIVWGVVQLSRNRNRADPGIAADERTHEGFPDAGNDAETDREIEELRERIKVLERIATDGNSLDAQETKRIADEIEALRDTQND